MGLKKDAFVENGAKETVETSVLKVDAAGPAVVGGSRASQDRTSEQDVWETAFGAVDRRVRGFAAASADDEEKREDVDDPGNIRSIDNLDSNSDSCKRNVGNTVKRIRML